MKVKDGLILRKVAGQYVIVPVGKRVREISSIVYLSAAASYLWDYMTQNEFEMEELVEMAMRHFTGVTEETVREDIRKFLETLAQNNILDDGKVRGSFLIKLKKESAIKKKE